jgi:hypothetical protein
MVVALAFIAFAGSGAGGQATQGGSPKGTLHFYPFHHNFSACASVDEVFSWEELRWNPGGIDCDTFTAAPKCTIYQR